MYIFSYFLISYFFYNHIMNIVSSYSVLFSSFFCAVQFLHPFMCLLYSPILTPFLVSFVQSNSYTLSCVFRTVQFLHSYKSVGTAMLLYNFYIYPETFMFDCVCRHYLHVICSSQIVKYFNLFIYFIVSKYFGPDMITSLKFHHFHFSSADV